MLKHFKTDLFILLSKLQSSTITVTGRKSRNELMWLVGYQKDHTG